MRRLLLIGSVAVLVGSLAACASGAASPAPSDDSSPTPPATGAPPESGDPDGSDDNGDDGDGTATDPPDIGNGGFLPGQPGQPELTVPRPGQQMVHPVAITELIVRVTGNRLEVNAKWWSGVEPCSVLDSIQVAREGTTITIDLFEGTSDPDAMCIAVAVEKVTLVDLGELPAGTYTVRAGMGEAPDVIVEVP